MDTGTWGLYYNYTWWGNAIQTAPSVIGKPDFFGSQFEMLTSQQPNQVLNGDFSTDSDWSKFNGATISNGKANIIGDGSAFTFIQQVNVFEVGKYYKITADVTINSGLGLKFQDGTTNENFGFALTTGSYTFYGTANSPHFIIGRRYGGTAFDSYVDNVSVQIVRADNVEAVKCLADWIHETQILDV